MEEITQDGANNPLEFKNRIDLSELQTSVAQIKSELGKVIIGQQEMIQLLIISILANGHLQTRFFMF